MADLNDINRPIITDLYADVIDTFRENIKRVQPAAGTLPGTTLKSTIVASSLTSVGTLTSLTVSGNTGLGTAIAGNARVNIGGSPPIAAALGMGVQANLTIPSAATGTYYGFVSVPNTQAASFILGELIHFRAIDVTKGSGSNVTTQTGFSATNFTSGSSSNIGFRGELSTGAGRWNLFMDGSAANYIAGSVILGGGSVLEPSAVLNIVSTTQGLGVPAMTTAQKNAIASPRAGLVVYDTTLGMLDVRGVAGTGSSVWGVGVAVAAPVQTVFTSGTNGIYNPPVGYKYLRVRAWGGGGGGGGGSGSSTGGSTGGVGGTTFFGINTPASTSPMIAAAAGNGGLGGGQGGNVGNVGGGGAGAASGLGTVSLPGAPGSAGATGAGAAGGCGGSGGGPGGGIGQAGGGGFVGSKGGGGGGGASPSACAAGGGGGQGGYCESIITTNGYGSFSYTVGVGGTAGGAGTGGTTPLNGGAGGAGYIIIDAFF